MDFNGSNVSIVKINKGEMILRLTSMKCYMVALIIGGVIQAPCLAADGFVENADEMVDQMLGTKKEFGLTRSFTVKEPKTRAIIIRRNNDIGAEESVVIQVPVTTTDPVVRLKVEFDVGSAHLRPQAYKILGELGKAVNDERVIDHKVCVKGHTDSDGEDSYNLGLSFDRAHTVQKFLEGTYGLPSDRIAVFGYGEVMPIVANNSGNNKQLNRRVEVSLNCAELNR